MPGGIGIFGGTFDPIHLGHLRGAEEVREALGLDEVRFVPAAAPPHRRGTPLAPANHRYRMVELAVGDVPGFRCWDVELARPGPSYSVDTLRALRAEVGTAVRVAFVLGFDAFRDFETWKEHAVRRHRHDAPAVASGVVLRRYSPCGSQGLPVRFAQ